MFTDDDLNRWKDYLKHKDGFKWFPHHSDISAIIARLEAAEKRIQVCECDIWNDDLEKEDKAWRKSKGESGRG